VRTGGGWGTVVQAPPPHRFTVQSVDPGTDPGTDPLSVRPRPGGDEAVHVDLIVDVELDRQTDTLPIISNSSAVDEMCDECSTLRQTESSTLVLDIHVADLGWDLYLRDNRATRFEESVADDARVWSQRRLQAARSTNNAEKRSLDVIDGDVKPDATISLIA